MQIQVRTVLRAIFSPFRYFGRGLRFVLRFMGRLLRRLVATTPRGRVRNVALLVLLIGVISGLFDYPKVWNTLAERVNTGAPQTRYAQWLRLPNVHNAPFKLGLDLLGGTHLVYEADMSNIPDAERADALSGVRDVIERRVNAFGVSEPLVQTNRTGGHYRIIAELAGIKDVNQAIKMIGETPTLDFRERTEETPSEPTTLEYTEISKEIEDYNKEAEAKASALLKQVQKGADFSQLAGQNSEDPGSRDKGGDLGFFGQGIMVPAFEEGVWNLKIGAVNPKLIRSDFGYHIIKKTEERMVEGKKQVRASHILITTKTGEATTVTQTPGWKQTELSGKQLKRAQVVFDPNTGEPTVQLTFNDEGDKLFAEITGRNVGQQVGIFLDGNVISAPVVQAEITGGTAVITGNFSLEEAKLLVRRLNAGALPVPITLVSQQTVDATLGSVSLARSLFAGILGFVVVVLFMLLFYRLPGLLASIALAIYTALTVAVFKLLGITMTLAGIAGFILSIGMAVDANILIFERVKEEIRRGRTLADALNEGFKRAWNSIRDSNASSLITCGILIWFGTSTVRGFAITLAIGIGLSMFSAITITRTFLRLVITPTLDKRRWLLGSGLKKNETV